MKDKNLLTEQNKEYIMMLGNASLSLKERKFMFIGILFVTILDKKVFHNKDELKEYIGIYEKILNKGEYKSYLYKSRTLLAARVLKDFKDIDDNETIRQVFKEHTIFIKQKLGIKDKNKSTNTNNNSLLKDILDEKRGIDG